MGDVLTSSIGIAATLIAGMVSGAAWALIVAIGRAIYGVNEVLTSLMLNFVAILVAHYLVSGSTSPWRDTNLMTRPVGREIARSLELPRIGATRLHWGFFVAMAATVLVFIVLRYSRMGFRMRILSSSARAAHYAGINVRRLMVYVLLTSGALAGLAGAIEVMGRGGRFSPPGLAIGLGYTGIVVAALARLSPFGVVITAVVLGGVANGTITLQSLSNPIPVSVSVIIEGTLILFVVAGTALLRYRWRWVSLRSSSAKRSTEQPIHPAPTQQTGARS